MNPNLSSQFNSFGIQSSINNPSARQSFQGPQLPPLAQSQAQLASSLWKSGEELPHQRPIVDQIRLVYERWDPANPQCAFKHYFYNKVDESAIPRYRPQPHEVEREWEEALERKPAPGFMPVLCSGFGGLAQRLQTQGRAVAEFSTRLHQINTLLDLILSRHELETDVRAAKAQRRHLALSLRCLALASRVQVLRNRGYALSADEDELRYKLMNLDRQVSDAAVEAHDEELWGRLDNLKGLVAQATDESTKPNGANVEVLDEAVENRAKSILEEYDVQIRHLRREVEGMIMAYGSWENVGITSMAS